MNTQKIIYRVVAPVVGKEPMVCDLGEYPGQQFTSRLSAALGAFEDCAVHAHVVLQVLSMASGAWVDMDAKPMLAQRKTHAARDHAQADAARVIELRARIEQLQDELAEAEQKAGASKRAAVAMMDGVVGEHEIGYAYASSDIATKAKKLDGCFYLKFKAEVVSVFDGYAEALLAAAEAGTTPSCWSMDHPCNSKYRSSAP